MLSESERGGAVKVRVKIIGLLKVGLGPQKRWSYLYLIKKKKEILGILVWFGLVFSFETEN